MLEGERANPSLHRLFMQESRGLRVVQTSLFQLQPDRPGADHPFRTPAAIPVVLSLDPKHGGHPAAAGDGFQDERFLPSLIELAVMHFFDFILDVAADDPVVRMPAGVLSFGVLEKRLASALYFLPIRRLWGPGHIQVSCQGNMCTARATQMFKFLCGTIASTT